MTSPLLLVHPGTHGVALYARELYNAIRQGGHDLESTTSAELERGCHAGAAVHAHFTDRLWGPTPERAAGAFQRLARGRHLSTTLHDVPQESDGPAVFARRAAAYAAVAASAAIVVVNSEHEAELLRTHNIWMGATAVIPLPVDLRPPSTHRHVNASVGVLGYYYPGKGHDEIATAAAGAGVDQLTVIGRASDGHAEDLNAFVRRAETYGVNVVVTGWLHDDELGSHARSVAVPVVAHRHVSASGSLSSWISWGRRPIVTSNRYSREMATLRPGTVTLASDGQLTQRISQAIAGHLDTWHRLAAVDASTADIASMYLELWGVTP